MDEGLVEVVADRVAQLAQGFDVCGAAVPAPVQKVYVLHPPARRVRGGAVDAGADELCPAGASIAEAGAETVVLDERAASWAFGPNDEVRRADADDGANADPS